MGRWNTVLALWSSSVVSLQVVAGRRFKKVIGCARRRLGAVCLVMWPVVCMSVPRSPTPRLDSSSEELSSSSEEWSSQYDRAVWASMRRLPENWPWGWVPSFSNLGLLDACSYKSSECYHPDGVEIYSVIRLLIFWMLYFLIFSHTYGLSWYNFMYLGWPSICTLWRLITPPS